MTILVLAEHSGGDLRKSASHAVTAASTLGPVTLALIGEVSDAAVGQARRIKGVAEVICACSAGAPIELAESDAQMLVDLVKQTQATHLFAAATPYGKGVLPRVAALLDVMQLSDIVRVESAEVFVRPVYAGSALATLRSVDAVKVVTVRVSAFAAAENSDAIAPVRTVEVAAGTTVVRLVSRTDTPGGDVELSDARIVMSGGRGMGSQQQFALLEPAAHKLGAAIGASRAAVDAGYASPDRQVGQTGKIIAPELYIAVGISGAVQHLAGMKDSRIIVAINKDAEAPIFQVADYGIVGDLFDVLPALEKAL